MDPDQETRSPFLRRHVIGPFMGTLAAGLGIFLWAWIHQLSGVTTSGDRPVRDDEQKHVEVGKDPGHRGKDKDTNRKDDAAKPPLVPREEPAEIVLSSLGMKFRRVPAGTFIMGSPAAEIGRGDDEDPHEVTITQPFYMAVCEVTQAQYRMLMQGKQPSFFAATGLGTEEVQGINTDDFPVESVSFHNATQFCRMLSESASEAATGRSYSLPTEAEWEYACRYGSRSPFSFGSSLTNMLANAIPTDRFREGTIDLAPRKTTRVGTYGPNPAGLFDMHGNVWEWCSDWYEKDYYRRSPKTDPKGPDHSSSNTRVIRGGSWANDASACRSAVRSFRLPTDTQFNLGFRVVMRKEK